VLEVNVPAAQSAHVRSREAVAVTFVCVPAAHTARVAVQAAPSSIVEWYPVWHAVHCRSVVVLPSPVLPSPAGHVDQEVHAWLPVAALKLLAAQALHVRSVAVVSLVLRYWPAWQTVSAVHSRSKFAVAA
jgi:hypothetical protein